MFTQLCQQDGSFTERIFIAGMQYQLIHPVTYKGTHAVTLRPDTNLTSGSNLFPDDINKERV